MKRLLPVITAACLIAAASASVVRTASAAGVNLSWSACGSFGTADRAFTCTTNTGTHTMFASYVTPAGIDSLNGNEIVIDLITSADPLPDWWKIGIGFCRASASMTGSYDFTLSPTDCLDYWAAQGLGSFNWTVNPAGFTNQTRRARFKGVFAIPSFTAGGVPAGTEVYSVKVNVFSQKSTGTGSCAGCLTPGCIVLNSIRLTQNAGVAGGNIVLTGAPAGGRDYVTWQGGVDQALCNLVPARNRTWGQVKSLYR